MATNRQKETRHGRSVMRLLRMLFTTLSLATAGCAGEGLLYTRVVSPYSNDFHSTPTGTKTCRVNEHIFREPFTSTDVSVNFTSSIVEEATRTTGMTNLYYADIETLSILNGIYQRKTLILCGD